MNQKIADHLDKVINDGLEKNYWFMTKQTMKDFYFIFTIAKIIKEYPSKRLANENFGTYYSRYFKEDSYLLATFPKQSESENTYRNAIISEFFGLFYRTKNGYDSGVVTPAFEVLNKYINGPDDIAKYRFIIDRQIEKLCLNINDKIQNYDDLKGVTIFPVMLLYKVLFELYKRTGDSTLYYDEFVVYLVRTTQYSDWENVVEMILSHRAEGLSQAYEQKYLQIFNDVTASNIRFDALFGTLSNIEYSCRTDRNTYKLKDSYETYRYIENAIEIFENSKFSNSHTSKSDLLTFMRSNKYFIGNLDVMFIGKDEVKSMDNNVIIIDESTRVDGGENVILYGVPGAGKSWTIKTEYCSNDNLIERLVFHPDYTYSDFVGQILPQLDENSNVSYKFTPGPFTKILKKAYRDPINHYYLVIEEVNRGNAPAIFGDVFQLLDRNGKGASEYSITNSDVATEVYGDANHKVSLPSNLSILGTMNTSDQNVFTLDTAFQRRWSMRLIENKFDKNNTNDLKFAGTKILDTNVTWEKFFTEINTIILNKNIRMTSSEDKRLGTHFIQIEDLIFDDYEGNDSKLITAASKHNRKFAEKVLKYLWDDAFKFNKDEIFDIKEMNSLEKVITTFMEEKGNKRFEKILKQNIYDALVPKQTN